MDAGLSDAEREALLVHLHAASGHTPEELGGWSFEFDHYDPCVAPEEHLGTHVARCGRCGRVDRERGSFGLGELVAGALEERGWHWRPVTRCPDCPRGAP